MSVIRDLLVGAVFLVPIGVGVGLVAAFGRDRTADEHDLWAHHDEPAADLTPRRQASDVATAAPVDEPGIVWHDLAAKDRHDRRHDRDAAVQAANPAVGRRIRPDAALTGPVGLAAWETATRSDGPMPPLARALMIEWAVPTLSDAAVRGIADDWLREIAAEQQARAGTVRVVSPATDRDLTGAFAVVAVA